MQRVDIFFGKFPFAIMAVGRKVQFTAVAQGALGHPPAALFGITASRHAKYGAVIVKLAGFKKPVESG
jgi:hypothetical protein